MCRRNLLLTFNKRSYISPFRSTQIAQKGEFLSVSHQFKQFLLRTVLVHQLTLHLLLKLKKQTNKLGGMAGFFVAFNIKQITITQWRALLFVQFITLISNF
jgi:hypothetical protein